MVYLARFTVSAASVNHDLLPLANTIITVVTVPDYPALGRGAARTLSGRTGAGGGPLRLSFHLLRLGADRGGALIGCSSHRRGEPHPPAH